MRKEQEVHLEGKIIPRWEWRTFAENLGAEGQRVLTRGEARVKESRETYVLSRRSDENTKIRDGLMDIKSLQAVNEDGLEQWCPIMKEKFPLSADKVQRLLDVLKVSAPAELRDSYTFGEFLSELVEIHPDLVAVDVKKRRHGLHHGAIVELRRPSSMASSRPSASSTPTLSW